MAQLTTWFRPMTPADVAAVARLEDEVFPDPWSEQAFGEELAGPGRHYLVCEEEGSVVGYGGLLVVGEDAHVTTLAVAPAARGRRLGTRMMLHLAEAALAGGVSNLTLEVRVTNEAAQRLYRRFGFQSVGLRRRYYRDEDALIMWALDVDSADYQNRLRVIREQWQ